MKKFVVVGFFMAIYIALGYLDFCLITDKVSIDTGNAWNWGWIIASMQMVYFVLSFRTVGPTELGALLLFGRPMFEVASGLVFAPFVICQLRTETALVVQKQIPGEPEEIDRMADSETPIQKGKVLPIRILTGTAKRADKEYPADAALVNGDPLHKQMTVEATAQVRMQIRDYLRFLKNIGSISSAMKQLRDTAEGVLKLEFASRTPALIPAHWGAINTAFEAKINAIVVSWGVDVHGAQLIDVDLTKTVNKGLRDALNSSLLKEAIIKTAEAEKEKRILEGQGDASAQLSLLTAQAEGKAKLAAIAKTKGGRYAMALETASKTVESADYSIVGTDGISGAIAAAMETMKKVHSPDKPAKAKKGG